MGQNFVDSPSRHSKTKKHHYYAKVFWTLYVPTNLKFTSSIAIIRIVKISFKGSRTV